MNIHEKYIKRCIQLAKNGLGTTYPNPMVGSVIVYDGKMHPVDSNDLSFKIAGMMAFKENFVNANPQLLEPIYKVTVTAPEEITGSIMSTIQSHRSMVEGMDSEGHFTIIKAQIPIAEMHEFTGDLRSLSQGRARISMEFDHYEAAPKNVQDEVIAKSKGRVKSAE